MFSWTQEVPYPGKRRLAGDVARAEIDVAGHEMEGIRLRVRSEVKAMYADLYRLDRTTSILDASRDLLLSFREAARARYESGEGILENVLKADTELGRLDADLAALGQDRRVAEVSLNALLGRTTDVSLGPALVAPRSEIPDSRSVEEAVLERSPELESRRSLARREESRLDLATRNLKPDFMWTAAYANRGGLDPMVTGMFGMRLPLYRQRKQAQAVVQTRYELDAARRDVASREVALLSEARILLARVNKGDQLVRLYGQGILAQARSALDAAVVSYEAGRAEFVTLIEDFRALLAYEVIYETERAEMLGALAALEQLTGASLVAPGNETEPTSVPGESHE